MAMSESRKRANRKYDKDNYKQQNVKMRIDEYNALHEYCNMLGLPINGFCRQVLMKAINYNKDESDL